MLACYNHLHIELPVPTASAYHRRHLDSFRLVPNIVITFITITPLPHLQLAKGLLHSGKKQAYLD